jgi:hypothetical protein
LRGLELKLSRRDARIRGFALKAKLGRNATLTGDLRPRRGGKADLLVEADDAGALFRFTDTYSRIVGGRMVVTMDPPSADPAPQHGTLNIENFSVRGETALDRVAATAAAGQRPGVDFTSLRLAFTRSPGQLSLRDGVVRGPLIGATIDGVIDYARNDIRMRGTLVPLYGTPVLRVNPISAVAPGFIRKFFEFPSANGQQRPPASVESTR